MNKKMLFLIFSFPSFALIHPWGETQKPSFASQKSEYKSKKLEREFAFTLFPASNEAVSMANKCFNEWDSCEQCKIFRRLIQMAALKLPIEKNIYTQ
jgi:hypothetical protein